MDSSIGMAHSHLLLSVFKTELLLSSSNLLCGSKPFNETLALSASLPGQKPGSQS